VCLPLVMLVERESLSTTALVEIPPREMSRSGPKQTSLTGRIGAALGVLVFIAITAFFYAHVQYRPNAVMKPPDKTQQDAKDHGQISPPYKTEQEKLDDAKRLREEYERMLKAGDALAEKSPDKAQRDAKQNDDEKLREELEELERNIEAARSRNGTDALVDADRRDINLLMAKLSTALSNKSTSELQEIWPRMADEIKMRDRATTGGDVHVDANKGALRGDELTGFDPTKKLSRTFHIKSLRISPDRKTADVTGTYEGKIISEGKEFPSSGKFNMKLSKRDGKWYIDKATF
jgi:hypothetical protein